MKLITILLLMFYFNGTCQNDPYEKELEYAREPVEIDTSELKVFEQASDFQFKLDYYHTDGYSTGDRYWYEVIILDTLLILNFNSPDNDDWDYINYQKQVVIERDSLEKIIAFVSDSKINQKTKGMPIPPGSGYGADKLFIESDNLNIAGGTVYMNVGLDMPEEFWKKKITIEKETSSTISGDFQIVFDYLEKLFEDLTMLMDSKDKEY